MILKGFLFGWISCWKWLIIHIFSQFKNSSFLRYKSDYRFFWEGGEFPWQEWVKIFGNSHVFFTLKAKNGWKNWEFPCLLYSCSKNWAKNLGIPWQKWVKKMEFPCPCLLYPWSKNEWKNWEFPCLLYPWSKKWLKKLGIPITFLLLQQKLGEKNWEFPR